jgi:hypothetical protein
MTVFYYIAAAIICLLPCGIALNFIKAYGVNVPVVDDYIFVEGFSQLASGNFSPDFFLGLHNGHCLLFGKILMLILGSITHFNIIAEMYLSCTFLILTFLLICSLAFKTLGRKPSTLSLMAPVSMLLFGLRPWDVFLNGSVYLNSMTIFFVVLTFILLERTDKEEGVSKTFIAAIITGIFGTFSGSAAGALLWPIGSFQILRTPLQETFKSAKCRMWTTLMISFGALYGALLSSANKSISRAHSESIVTSLTHKLAAIPDYLFTLIGSPFCADPKVVMTYGIAILLTYFSIVVLFLVKRPYSKHTAAFRAAVSLFLFGLAAVALITYGRSDRGYLEATASRYVQFSELLLLGAYLSTCFCYFQNKLVKPFLLVVLIGMAVTLYWVGYAAAPLNGMFWRNLQLKHAYFLRTYKIQADPQLSELQSNPFFVKQQAAKLEELHLSVFSRPYKNLDDVAKIKGEPAYCLDKLNTAPPAQIQKEILLLRNSKEPLTISGWAFDNQSMQVAKRVAVLLYAQNSNQSGDQNNILNGVKDVNRNANQSLVVIPACYGLIYPGVAEGFHAKKLGDCGFFASFAPSIMAPGRYRLCLAVESTDGKHLQISKPLAVIEIK